MESAPEDGGATRLQASQGVEGWRGREVYHPSMFVSKLPHPAAYFVRVSDFLETDDRHFLGLGRIKDVAYSGSSVCSNVDGSNFWAVKAGGL